MNIYPSLEKLKAFCRLGSPIGYFPANDTQFYMYFCDQTPINLDLNQDEFTEYKWLAIDEAIAMYEK